MSLSVTILHLAGKGPEKNDAEASPKIGDARHGNVPVAGMVIQATVLLRLSAKSTGPSLAAESLRKRQQHRNQPLRRVKAARENSCITEFSRQPTADDLLESLRSETVLAKMDWFEEVAQWHDAETCPLTRHRFAESYRRAIGVNPHHRQQLRRALERVRDGGGMPVTDVIQSINRDHS